MKMKYIKEYWLHDGKFFALIRTAAYCHTLKHFMDMFDEICKDYPPEEVNTDNINVTHYGGDRIKGTYGLEFPIVVPNSNYTKISKPEWTL